MGRELNLAFQKRQLGDYEYSFVLSEGEARMTHLGKGGRKKAKDSK